MEEFMWVDDDVAENCMPPQVQRAREQLKARPGKWAMLVDAESVFFATGWWRPLEDHPDYELKVGSTGDGRVARRVYGRYIGENKKNLCGNCGRSLSCVEIIYGKLPGN